MPLNALPPVPRFHRKRTTLWAIQIIAIVPNRVFITGYLGSPASEQISVNSGIVLRHSTPIKTGARAFPPIGTGEITNALLGYSEEFL
jgi:hypothetical protein